MKRTTLTSIQPAFSVICGLLGTTDKVTILAEAAWLFASTVLWNHFIFSAAEKENCKQLIRVELAAAAATAKAFTRFCECIILSKLSAKSPATVLPGEWLAGDEKRAAVLTLDGVVEIRRSLPGYQRAVKALAEAVLEMSEESTPANFQYWRSYFIERQELQLLELFTLYCANLHYLND